MRYIGLMIFCSFATVVGAQAPATKPPAATGYTPPPVSTTYRPLAGKLFFTDAERERLDKARRDGVQIVDGEVISRSPRLEGFVRSSSGRTTYWVDGRQRFASDASKDVPSSPAMTGTEPMVTFRESQPTAKPSDQPVAAIRKATKSNAASDQSKK